MKLIESAKPPKLTEKDYNFFSTLADAIEIFKAYDLPNGNCKGCMVFPKKIRGKNKVIFKFAIAQGRILDTEIDLEDIKANPKDYIGNMLEVINAAVQEAKREFDSIIHVPRGSKLSKAVSAVNQMRII